MVKHNRFGDELKELRCEVPKHILDVADAKADSETRATGRLVSRGCIINQVLSQWAESHIDEAILILKLTGVNPTVSEKAEQK